ncbi:hypothetical protein R75461_08369 [Paraburkholderia nemoris]|nr:hypothetical protein R75461_08369 [Paraburkholderia nemoris]
MVVSELLIVLMSVVFCVTRPSMLVRAPPTLVNVLPPIVYDGALIAPVVAS